MYKKKEKALALGDVAKLTTNARKHNSNAPPESVELTKDNDG